jgi:hypothetical protein
MTLSTNRHKCIVPVKISMLKRRQRETDRPYFHANLLIRYQRKIPEGRIWLTIDFLLVQMRLCVVCSPQKKGPMIWERELVIVPRYWQILCGCRIFSFAFRNERGTCLLLFALAIHSLFISVVFQCWHTRPNRWSTSFKETSLPSAEAIVRFGWNLRRSTVVETTHNLTFESKTIGWSANALIGLHWTT